MKCFATCGSFEIRGQSLKTFFGVKNVCRKQVHCKWTIMQKRVHQFSSLLKWLHSWWNVWWHSKRAPRRIFHLQRKFFSTGKVLVKSFFKNDWSHLNVVGDSASSRWKHTLAPWIFFFTKQKVYCGTLNGRCHALQEMCCNRIASFLILLILAAKMYVNSKTTRGFSKPRGGFWNPRVGFKARVHALSEIEKWKNIKEYSRYTNASFLGSKYKVEAPFFHY